MPGKGFLSTAAGADNGDEAEAAIEVIVRRGFSVYFPRIHRVFAAYFLCTLRVLLCTLRVFSAYFPHTPCTLRVFSPYSLCILRVFSMYSTINFAISLNCVCVYLYVPLSVHVRCVCREHARTYTRTRRFFRFLPIVNKPPFVVAVAFRGTAFPRLGIARFAFRKSALRGIRARFTKIYRALRFVRDG